MYQDISKCRGCAAEGLVPFLSLGNQYVVDFVKERDDNALRAPLTLVKCPQCHLVQLNASVNPDRLYKKFWYKSGTNEQMKRDLHALAVATWNSVRVKAGDYVLDIGANDGTLLSFYPEGVLRVGIDPCKELIDDGLTHHRMDIGIASYFSANAVKPAGVRYKIITAVAMFYDLEDPVHFLRECAEVLADDGVLVIQQNYLVGMLTNCAFDNICHEHLTYFTATTMQRLVDKAGLEIAGAETNEVNGGSLRLYITHKGRGVPTTVARQMQLYGGFMNRLHHEIKLELDTMRPYDAFARRISSTITSLREHLMSERKDGAHIFLYGASTRGSTLMQALDLPEGIISGAAERDSSKVGLYTVGTWIPILSEAAVRPIADQFLLLPWHFWESIRHRERKWLDEPDHKMIIPLPIPRVASTNVGHLEETPLYTQMEVRQ